MEPILLLFCIYILKQEAPEKFCWLQNFTVLFHQHEAEEVMTEFLGWLFLQDEWLYQQDAS